MKHVTFQQRALFGCVAFVGLQGALGCSLIVDPDKQVCATNQDCQSRGAAFASSLCIESLCRPDPKWACAEHRATLETQAAIQAPFTVTNLVDFQPLAGVRVTLCGALDLMCLTPIAQSETDGTGVALINLPQSSTGYYLLVESATIEPMLFMPTSPVKEGESLGTALVSPKGALQSLAGQLNDVLLDKRTLVVTQVYDCQQQMAPGATIEYTGNITGSHPYYALDGIPSGSATVTDATGVAGLLNAMPGTIGIRVKFGDRSVGEASVLVREGYMSYRPLQLGRLN